MSFIFRFLISFCFFISLSNGTRIDDNDMSKLKVLTKVWEELEEYRAWTAAHLEYLDVHTRQGEIDPVRVSEIKTDIPQSAVDFYRDFNCPSYLPFYFFQVQDRFTDYCFSEGLYASMELLFEHRNEEISAELVGRVKQDITAVLRGAIRSFYNCCNLKSEDREFENSDLGSLVKRMFDVLSSGDVSSYPNVFHGLSDKEEALLSELYEGENNLFCSKLFVNIIVLLESVFPTPKGQRSAYEWSALESLLFSHARTYIRSHKMFNIHTNISEKYRNLMFSNFLERGKFKFSEMEGNIGTFIHEFLLESYGDLVSIENPSKPEVKNLKMKAENQSKGKKKARRKAKKKNSQKRGRSLHRVSIESASAAGEPIIKNSDIMPLVVIDAETIEKVVVAEEGSKVEETNVAAAFEGDEALSEFHFDEWYFEEVVSRIIPAYIRNEEDAALPSVEFSAATVGNTLPKFNFGEKAEAFYKAVIGAGTRPVSKTDFDSFLKAVNGKYDSKPKPGSAVGYWLPNLSDTRARNPYLRFTVHIPHSGSEEFPLKTLKYFLRNAFRTCCLSKGVS